MVRNVQLLPDTDSPEREVSTGQGIEDTDPVTVECEIFVRFVDSVPQYLHVHSSH